MTASQKRQWSLGGIVSLVAILTAFAGWHARSFASGREEGELRGKVVGHDVRLSKVEAEITDLRRDMNRGFERVLDRIDQRTQGYPPK